MSLFASDPGRGQRVCAQAVGLYLDHSKNRVTGETTRLLVAQAEDSGVPERHDAMFRSSTNALIRKVPRVRGSMTKMED